MDPSRADSRYNLNYSMSSIGLSLADQADMYGNPTSVAALGGRPPSGGLIQTMGGGGSGSGPGVSGGFSTRGGSLMPNTTQCQSLINSTASSSVGPVQQQRGIKRAGSDCYEDHHRSSSSGMVTQSLQGLESCGAGGNGQHLGQQQQPSGNVSDIVDDNYNALHNKKSPPANGKKTKGRVKIKMEYIDNKLRRYTTFSKRKTGIMKKAYELSTLTGTQVMLLVASETGHVYTFATRKLQPMITSEAGKQLIQTCLNSPDPPSVGGGDQRMSATGFEETELSYNIADEDSKDDRSPLSSINESDDSSDIDSPATATVNCKNTLTNTDGRLLEENTSISYGKKCEQHPAVNDDTEEKMPKNTLTIAAESVTKALSTRCDNLIYSSTALANIPQEVLLQLIQSGHLQLHTEEDGSGHQYVAIPLSSSTVNMIAPNSKDISAQLKESNLSNRTEKSVTSEKEPCIKNFTSMSTKTIKEEFD